EESGIALGSREHLMKGGRRTPTNAAPYAYPDPREKPHFLFTGGSLHSLSSVRSLRYPPGMGKASKPIATASQHSVRKCPEHKLFRWRPIAPFLFRPASPTYLGNSRLLPPAKLISRSVLSYLWAIEEMVSL